MSANVEIFAGHRDRLFGIAYRMLGSRADAEDVLQDAWLRWHEQDAAALRSTEAWLTTMVTRLAIDRLRAAKTQRAVYFGPWLPEPLAEVEIVTPESHAEFASDLSVAFLALLERLGEEERAAFVLHDVFDCDYDDIAETLGKTPAACRQLVHRARERVATERRRFRVDDEARIRMLRRFMEAAQSGDFNTIKSMFAPDARMTSDGGGKAIAVFRPLLGAERIARLWWAISRRREAPGIERRIVRVNGEIGLAFYFKGRLHSVATVDTDGERIFGYYSIANPDKLRVYAQRQALPVTGPAARAS
ncbi:MAG TPA: RNA polymerase sigma factor SigJ [Steroidobacteraceae bacterium]|nr:RNA polymerase sigma factor SigJ [Steroidobacteraceae bacterium]